MLLPATGSFPAVDVIRKDVVVEEGYGDGDASSSTAKQVYMVPMFDMNSVFLVYNVPFLGLVKTLDQLGEGTFKVELL